jgi:hemerythrin-like domain-containing protein
MTCADDVGRRAFLTQIAVASGGLFLGGCAAPGRGRQASSPQRANEQAGPSEEISPAEDLMREHGVLRRILLVYGDVTRKLRTDQELPPEPLADAARIIRSFVEDYHERLEEEHLFPRFRQAGKLVALVDVLQAQHEAGRRLTDTTLRLATAAGFENAEDRQRLSKVLHEFTRMYNPHAAREDTVLFPALHDLLTEDEYNALGDQFEQREHDLFGPEGFERTVDRVAGIEKTLGIYDLVRFTPQVQATPAGTAGSHDMVA